MKRYFRARDPAWFGEENPPYLTQQFDVAAGEDPSNYTWDVRKAGIFNTEDDFYLLTYEGTDYAFVIEWLPEDQQMKLNGQLGLFGGTE